MHINLLVNWLIRFYNSILGIFLNTNKMKLLGVVTSASAVQENLEALFILNIIPTHCPLYKGE